MRRKTEEMLASQKVMLRRLGQKGGNIGDKDMAAKLEKHLRNVEVWVTSQNNMEVLYID